MTAKSIMFQGTGSSVGKSVIAAAFCRIFKQDGYRTAPFKSQNMALNSYITREGGEMGRAQVVQAEAAGIEPVVDMNPVLIKPSSDCNAQVIVQGRVCRNMSAAEYDRYKPDLMKLILDSYNRLAENAEIMVIEGAGSPAEINLKDRDIVNMGFARRVDAPVVLIGDIDKGGVFASLYGTVMLLDSEERKHVKGVIINKFRGDVELLKPGLAMIEELVGIPVLGVIPYFDLCIDDEDSVTERFRTYSSKGGDGRVLDIAVVKTPYMSNYTDFAPLERQPGVVLRYMDQPDAHYEPDLIILPGSKNTMADLKFIRDGGIEDWIMDCHGSGGLIMGICGGFQMLGLRIEDPETVESDIREMDGLGLLNIRTRMAEDKMTTRVKAEIADLDQTILQRLSGTVIEGYEIHMGISDPCGEVAPFSRIGLRLNQPADAIDGYRSPDGRVFGTYIHGIFDTPDFLGKLLQMLRERRGLTADSNKVINYREFKEAEYDKLADIIRNNVDMESVYRIVVQGLHGT